MTNVIQFKSRAQLEQEGSSANQEPQDERPDTEIENIFLASSTEPMPRNQAEEAMKYAILQAHEMGLKVVQLDQKKTSKEGEEPLHAIIFAFKGAKDKVMDLETALKTGKYLKSQQA